MTPPTGYPTRTVWRTSPTLTRSGCVSSGTMLKPRRPPVRLVAPSLPRRGSEWPQSDAGSSLPHPSGSHGRDWHRSAVHRCGQTCARQDASITSMLATRSSKAVPSSCTTTRPSSATRMERGSLIGRVLTSLHQKRHQLCIDGRARHCRTRLSSTDQRPGTWSPSEPPGSPPRPGHASFPSAIAVASFATSQAHLAG